MRKRSTGQVRLFVGTGELRLVPTDFEKLNRDSFHEFGSSKNGTNPGASAVKWEDFSSSALPSDLACVIAHAALIERLVTAVKGSASSCFFARRRKDQ